MMNWFNSLMGAKTASTICFAPNSIFVVHKDYVAVHQTALIVRLYYYADDVREDLYNFFHERFEEGREAELDKRMRTAPPYNIGDIIVDVLYNVIYTAGVAVGTHSVAGSVTSTHANVYTSTRTYINE